MRICFDMHEAVYRNNETVMEYSSSMKKIGLIAGGAFVALTALNVYSHYKVHQAIADRKVKKQLAPLNDKLDALQAENRMLRAELEKRNAPSEEQN